MELAILSDTHVPEQAEDLPEPFRDRIAAADHVVHAGDFGSVEAFEAVRGKVAPGGIVAADNAVAGGTIDAADLLAYFDGEGGDLNAMSRGIADYIETVRADSDFETTLLPLGEGVAVSQREW